MSGLCGRNVRVEPEAIVRIKAPLQLPQPSPRIGRVRGRDPTSRLVELRIVEVPAAAEREWLDPIGETTGPRDLRLVVRWALPDRERRHVRDGGAAAERGPRVRDPVRLAVNQLDECE